MPDMAHARKKFKRFEWVFWGPAEWDEDTIEAWVRDFEDSPQLATVRQLLQAMDSRRVIGWEETDWQGHSQIEPPDWSKD